MTIREGIKKLLDCENLDEQLQISIVHRGEHNIGLFVEVAPVVFIKTLRGHVCAEASQVVKLPIN